MRMHRAVVAVLVAVLVAVTVLMVPAGGEAASSPLRPSLGSSLGPSLRPSLGVGEKAWVAVSVATLWRTPDSPHPVDAPALARPARITRWLAGMTTEQRRSLGGRADTQALLGDQVLVVRLQGDWARVVVPSQPSQLDVRGYPGWVPLRQLTAVPPTREPLTATVVRRTAWLSTDEATPRRVFPMSFGTRLPVVAATSRFVRVRTPLGDVRRIVADAVVVHDRGEPAIAPSRASLVRTARSFVGLPYLWSGLSGFGLDCSGLTWLDYRVHGIRIPRDALPQSAHGSDARPLRPGDLMFYATAGRVHHVSMYAGHGRMVHAPGTGQQVQVIETSTPAYQREYAGARRYLP